MILLGIVCINLVSAALVAHWPFEEGSGTTTADTSGNGNTGTLANMDNSNWVAGKVGNYALSYDGINESVNVGNDPSLHPVSAITVEAWVKRDATGTPDVILSPSTNSGSDWFLDVTSEKARFGVKVGGTFYFPSGTTTISAGSWYHIAGTYDGETVRVFVNGVEEGNDTSPSGNMDTTTNNVRIGDYVNTPSSGIMNGTIDDVWIYDEALNSSTIYQHYLGNHSTQDTIPEVNSGKMFYAFLIIIAVLLVAASFLRKK